MRVLILGAYGLIGADIVRAMRDNGHEVVGLVRSRQKATRLLPGIPCIEKDIALLCEPESWRQIISGFDAVVNASGALQNSFRDNLSALQDRAICALISACEKEGVHTFVQISVPGANVEAATLFMQSKAVADTALRASALNWVIFKPGLVISRTAYGGTALIRALAGFPVVLPMMLGNARIQTVSSDEVAQATLKAVNGKVPLYCDYDLMSGSEQSLAGIVMRFREWLGVSPARMVLNIPSSFGYLVAKCGDFAGWLGWRSPLRTTALRVLEEGVVGDGTLWAAANKSPYKTLDETLNEMPSTLQDRTFAKSQLLIPVVVLLLSCFFISTGVIALFRAEVAASILSNAMTYPLSMMFVVGGALLDIVLGVGILVRSLSKLAAMLMIALSTVYLTFGTVLTPSLWADPLGPFLKILPVIGLALTAALLIEER